MNYLQKLIQQVKLILFVALLLDNILLFTVWYTAKVQYHLPLSVIMAILLFGGLLITLILAGVIGSFIMQPIRLLWQTILHVSPHEHELSTIPRSTTFWLGKDLVANLTGQIYQLVNVASELEKVTKSAPPDLHKNTVANNLPLPLVILDKDETIIFANNAMLLYVGKHEADVIHQNVYSVLDLSFTADQTSFDTWLAEAKKNSVTDTQTWDRVRLPRPDNLPPLQFDLAAYYNKANPEYIETMLLFFDHTLKYAEDDQAISFVALAVHELRTPLTLLRGYVEVLDRELEGHLDAEMSDFLHKMKAASQQLSAFVNNILNVARIEGDQLTLRLHEENWAEIVDSSVNALRLRAQVRGIELTCAVSDDLPTVGVDRISVYEVMNNLIDNAIKYSGKGKKIIVNSSLGKDGLVETTVQDFGVGIAESVVPTLFNRFQRNYHNRTIIGGTGLGLYLSKAIVSAHGGNIWVRSKEGQGTTIGFTIMPYATLSEEQKNDPNSEIIRNAHGWIKNHSLYRR